MPQEKHPFHVGIIGGGIAGSTVALRFVELGVKVTLFERGPSLVNGPPICHLHSGGNLYREIPDAQCLTLLEECIDTLRIFPHTINFRPTMIAVPKYDAGSPLDILPRLIKLREAYQKLVSEDWQNGVLGDPKDYFKTYSHADILRLRNLTEPDEPKSFDDWMIPVSKHLVLDGLKFPIIMVQEYGWSIVRMAATVTLALSDIPNCEVKTNTKVLDVEECSNKNGWTIFCEETEPVSNSSNVMNVKVDYLVNASGYQTGTIDNCVGVLEERMVEFKAAYVAKWEGTNGNVISSQWPEIIIHGTRGTPRGMVQITPYPDGIFQLHGMTKDITLFTGGMAKSTNKSSQPQLCKKFETKLENGWNENETEVRTKRAIRLASQFIPAFSTASVSGPPLFGAQQIPGNDPILRTASVSFPENRYARVEIVKGSSAPSAADAILRRCVSGNLLCLDVTLLNAPREKAFSRTLSLSLKDVVKKAEDIAQHRNWPLGLARPVGEMNSQIHKGKNKHPVLKNFPYIQSQL